MDNSSFPEISVDIELVVGTPAHAKNAVPLITEFGFNWTPAQLARFRRGQATGPSWKQELLAKGWGYAILVPGSIQADNGAGLTQGIIGLVNKEKTRTPEQWGSLRAWACIYKLWICKCRGPVGRCQGYVFRWDARRTGLQASG